MRASFCESRARHSDSAVRFRVSRARCRARQICTNGPYKSVSDLYNIKGMSEKEKNVIKKYESRLLVGPPEPAYVIDRINNGLYR